MRPIPAASLLLVASLLAVAPAGAQPRGGTPPARAAPGPSASLEPKATSAPATGELELRWTGPAAKDDRIVFARVSGSETRHYGYVRDGNPLKIRVPGEPGEYELRYVSDASGAVLARVRVTVTPVAATLEVPGKGVAGSEIAVAFTGPNANEDWVGLAKPGSDPDSYEAGAWVYANNGAPARLRLPVDPGTYEVRYVSGLDPRILAARTVEVAPASAALTVPASGMAGTTIRVGFTGRGGGDTFIGIVRPGAKADTWIAGAYERPAGSAVPLRLPGVPGSYEVRFVLEANGAYRVLAASPITVEPAVASVSAPDHIARGADVAIAFAGPAGEGDFVAIAPVGSAAAAFTDYRTAAPDRSSVTLQAPEEAGAYEVRYVMAAPGEAGTLVVARRPLTVE
jgi:Ca-activated chloride channel family protein